MHAAPVLRAHVENGEVWDDPSEDLLFMLFSYLEQDEATFIIVEWVSDTSGLTYVQAARNDDGSYQVEYQAGSLDHHYGTTVPDMRTAHRIVTDWAFDLNGWAEAWPWLRMTL
jgi:hypothetical protein